MTALDVAERQQQLQERIGIVAANRALLLWRRLRAGSLAELIASWLSVEALMVQQVSASQFAAAVTANQYLDALEPVYGITTPAPLQVAPESLAGLTAGGWPLRDSLVNAAAQTAWALRLNMSPPLALASGAANLKMHVETDVADIGRAAEQVAMTARPWPKGYVRMLEPGACSRCIVLAGKHYKRNAGFRRHPSCRCHHVPVAEDAPNDVRTDPQAYFDKLPKAEQDRIFTAAGAEAIRRGADMSQVVNVRLGMSTATVGGQTVQTTTQGTARRAYMASVRKEIANARGESRARKQPRLMPEAVLRLAGDDTALARRLLISNGYIVGDIKALAAEAAA